MNNEILMKINAALMKENDVLMKTLLKALNCLKAERLKNKPHEGAGMTVKDFLEAGHKFVKGDIFSGLNCKMIIIRSPGLATNMCEEDDVKRFVIYAKCLGGE